MVDGARHRRKGGAPRPLTATERQVIAALLAPEIAGIAELRGQLDGARVLRRWSPAGSPSFDLVTRPDAPRSPIAEPILPLDAEVLDDDGSYLGELVLWLAEGRLAALEYAWVTDAMPPALPAAESLRISPRGPD